MSPSVHHNKEDKPAGAAKASRLRRSLPLLAIYVFRVVLMPTLAVGGIVFFALALERVLRLVRVVTQHGASANEAWGLILFLIPHYLEMALPAGLFFGVMLGIRHLHDRSELVVIRSFGVSMGRLLAPVGTLAVLLMLATLALTTWIQPIARYHFRERMNTIVSRDVLGGLAPGVFLPVGPGNVVRARSVDADGESFEGFFMARRMDPDSREFLTAATAQVVKTNDSTLKLMLFDGMLIRETSVNGFKTISLQLRFEELPISISTDNLVAEPGPRGHDAGEMTASELVAGGVGQHEPKITAAQMRAELYWRAGLVVSLPLLGMMALPLALIGQGRSARAGGLAVGLVVLIVFEKTARLGKVMAESDRIPAWLGLGVPCLGLLVLAVLAYRWFSGDLERPRGGKMRAIRALPVKPSTEKGA